MNTKIILLSALSLVVAGSAAASDHLSDADYLKANRCRGLAAGTSGVDTASLDALLKTEGRSRLPTIYTMGEQEMERGRRAASQTDSKERVAAELNGYCTAFVDGRGSGRETATSR
jgi:hypothetical protein